MSYHDLSPTQIHPKVAAAGIGGAVATLVIAVASLFFHADLSTYGPAIVAGVGAIVTIASFASGYMKSSRL